MKTKIFSLLIVIIILSGCKLNREQRRANRKSKKIEQIAKEEGLYKTDTASATVQYITEVARIDTFILEFTDTVYLENENLSLSIIKKLGGLEINAICDTIRDTIEVNIPYETIQPVEYIPVPIKLSKWSGFMMKLGNGVFWLLVAAIVFLIVRIVIKFYTGK